MLWRESFREGRKVRTRTLAHLTSWAPERIEALRRALKGEFDGLSGDLPPTCGPIFGVLFVLKQLADRIGREVGEFRYRVFTDSAPVMEVELAGKAGLGWRGKHTLLLNREAGSYFFLGEIYTDLQLPVDRAQGDHCGTCQKCIDICPTHAILGPYQLDARRCISYLTIEHKGAIPEELRPLIGNRVYGCDDCQLVCPWNKFASPSDEPDFAVRNGLDDVTLVELFGWSEAEFHERLAGSAIHRIGYERWLRNLAVGLGNAPKSEAVMAALKSRETHPSGLVREHVVWAIMRQNRK